MLKPRHHVLRHSVAELAARNPSLINVPLPVNSVPVVGPLIAPLIGGGGGGSPQPSAPPSPQPAPDNGSGGSNGGGKGNGEGNGNSGGNGDGGGNGNGGGNGSGGSPNGGGGGVGQDGGNTPTAPSPTSGGAPAIPSPSIVPNPTSSNSAPGNPSNSPNIHAGSSSGMAASPSGPVSNGNMLGIGNGKIPPVNAGSVPSATSGDLDASAVSMLATGSPSPSIDTNTLGTAASPTISAASLVSSGKRLSGGAIAGITIVCLFSLLALVLLVVRRRSIAHRMELRKQWWLSRNGSGNNFHFASRRRPRSPAGLSGEYPASRLSARSSFATNFDQGLYRTDSPPRFSLALVPDLPPMAEVRERSSVLISTGGSVARRESMNSMLSNGSGPDAQYLTVSTGQSSAEPSTPMSVRPFSPSESFAFPKPPAPPLSSTDSFLISGSQGAVSFQSSAITLVHLNTPPRALMLDMPPAPVSTPHTPTPSDALSPFIAASNPSTNVSTDPAQPEFSPVEVIRRPFKPSQSDELPVRPGDHVRILRVFDDGWAFVEKLAGTTSERHERGLIPVDCFRRVDQSLPSFLSENRVNHGSEHLIATAI